MAKPKNIRGLDGYLKRLNNSIRRIKGNSLKGLLAVYVHENPRAGQTGGRGPSGGRKRKPEKGSSRQVFAVGGNWKFLEGPLRRSRRMILRIIADRVKLTEGNTK